ncbi:condensin-2 complex subunit D3-like [Aphidius gifuensis]|uniref:condensin-2 complex subunit D3-like n=1 Tax=Aphidius gifuensis TaxID=684658 RepID=UPI001CDC7CB9|nr:condensin-2 complex subunit D3-like [Aphidius gifuensis]
MAPCIELIKVFDKFMLNRVDKTWVQTVWDNEFIIFEKIDDEYLSCLQSNGIGLLLRDTSKIIKHWVAKNNNFEATNINASWQTLRSWNVDPHCLLPVLGYLIKIGQDQEANEDYRQICLRSTSLYLTLLSVSGSSVYQIFHENLYQKALDTLEFSTYVLPSDKKMYLNFENLCLSEKEFNKISQCQKTTLIKGLNAVIYELILLLKSSSWSFRGYKRSLESTVNTLIQITRLGTENNPTSSPSSGSLSTLIQNAYAALQLLCQECHGLTETTIKLIIKSMMQNFLVSSGNLSVKLTGLVRNTSVEFLKSLLEDYKKKAETGILLLIQGLIMNCPERLELRQKQAIIIGKLINIGKKRTNLMKKIIDDLILFSHQNKVSHRVFAQEIIGRYLLDLVNTPDEDTSIDNRNLIMQQKISKTLLATVLSRTTDISCMVRGRALSTIKEYTDQPSNLFLETLFTSTDDEHYQAIPVLEDLRESISSDIKILPEKNFLISMLKIRAEDERAIIRRSAILILENVVAINSDILETAIHIVSKHCQDPAMTVRRSAIQVLTSFLKKYPDYPNFYGLWIKSVIPQVFDIEISVQEKVLEIFENLIIHRILLSSASNNDSDSISWKIINKLNTMKMRKHLTKICEAWTRTGALTNDFIIKVQSKIESEHKQAAWILLSSISKVIQVPNMDKYFLNCQDFLLGKKFLDYLSLEVLRSSLSNLKNSIIKKIKTEFYESLKDFKVHPRIVSITLDILYSSYHECIEDQANIRSVMEELISRSRNIIKHMIKDNSKFNNVKLYIKAVSTLGHASFLCKNKIELSTLRVFQGIIIDSESMPDLIKNQADLQAAIVVVLGQQAMRDQSIAHEMMPIFRQLLCTHNMNSKVGAAVRVNAAKALVDVCTRFTSVVEPFLPDMCITMKDSERTVREAIVILLIELLVEDFVKVKGPFFFHILTMLTDEDKTIKDMTIFLVRERLLMKNKNLMATQFFGAIFHYNGVILENKFYRRKMKKNEKLMLTLPGSENFEKRKTIYKFLLDNLELIGWLKLLEKVNTVFESILFGDTLNLTTNNFKCLVKDILWIVSSGLIQINSLCIRRNSFGEDDTLTNNMGIIGDKIEKHKTMVLLPTLVKLSKKISLLSDELDAEIVNTLVEITGTIKRDQLVMIYEKFPEIKEKMQRNLSSQNLNIDEDFENSICPPISKSTPTKSLESRQVLNSNRQTKIVLRRVSGL